MDKKIEVSKCPRLYAYGKKYYCKNLLTGTHDDVCEPQRKGCGFYINYIEQELQAEKEKVKGLEERNGWSNDPCDICRYKQALEEIKGIAAKGLEPICYKSNCNRCKCYQGECSKAALTAIINSYFDENGNFVDENGDFVETLEGLLDDERSKCNKAQPICEQILQKCEVLNG